MAASQATASIAESPGDVGLLLIGHGTRDPEGQAEWIALADRVAARMPNVPCQPCALEFANPTIEEGVRLLANRGARRIVAMPVLLFAAGHVKQDIPAALAAAAKTAGGMPIRQTGYLGCHPKLIELSNRRFRAAIDQAGTAAPLQQTLHLMVGRGSSDPEANGEMAQFARRAFERSGTGWSELCFTALAEPSLERGLDFVASQTVFRQLVVQPHLLFRGALVERIRGAVTSRQAGGDKHWLLAERLGVDDLLVEAVVEIAGFGNQANR